MAGFISYFERFWVIINDDNNDGIVIAMLFTIFSLLIVVIDSKWSCYRRIKEKDEHIKDIVTQRNQFQKVVLK